VIQLSQNSIGFCLGVFVYIIKIDAWQKKEIKKERSREKRQEERK
jgi:hypothetical protein